MNRYTKVSHEGIALPDDTPHGDVGGLRINRSGIIVAPLVLCDGEDVDQPTAVKAASELTLGGHQWRAPEVEEAFDIPDRTRIDPALDPIFWQFLIDAIKKNGTWSIWTNTALAGSPGWAWFVGLGYGLSGHDHQDDRRLALAVRGPVPFAGQ